MGFDPSHPCKGCAASTDQGDGAKINKNTTGDENFIFNGRDAGLAPIFHNFNGRGVFCIALRTTSKLALHVCIVNNLNAEKQFDFFLSSVNI